MPISVRSFFEPRFGRDLGRVRLHTDASAAALSRAVSAKAFVVGRDIFFGAGQYDPGAPEGRRLLAHELAHVLQQSPEDAPVRGGEGRAAFGVTPSHTSPQPYIARVDCSTLSQRSCNGVHSCGYGGSGKCYWGGPSRGCVCYGSTRRTAAEAWQWIQDTLPMWIIVLLTAAAIAAIVACFATGVCEAAAIVGAVGATAAVVILLLLRQAGVDVQDSGRLAGGETAPSETDTDARPA